MEDKHMLEFLKALLAPEDADTGMIRYDGQTADCLSVPRFFDIAYRPSTESEEEKAHISGCPFCSKQLEAAVKEAYHPGLLSDRTQVETHVEKHGCERADCRRLHQLLKSKEWLVERIKGLAAVIPVIAAASPNLAWAFGGIGETGEFAPKESVSKTFELAKSIEEHSIDVLLRDTDGQLCIYVDSEDRNKAGAMVRVNVLFPRGQLSKDIVLEKRERYGPHGFHSFGSFPEKIQELGSECVLVATLMETGTKKG